MFRLVFLALLAVSWLAGSAPALAQSRRAPERQVQTLDHILPKIRSHYPGTFYDAEGPFPDQNGAPHYRLKWMMPNGRVVWLNTDARTGRVTSVEHGPVERGYRYGAAPSPYDLGPPPNYPPPGRYFGGSGFPGGNFPPGSYYGGPRGGHGGGHGWFGGGRGGSGGHGGGGHGHHGG